MYMVDNYCEIIFKIRVDDCKFLKILNFLDLVVSCNLVVFLIFIIRIIIFVLLLLGYEF